MMQTNSIVGFEYKDRIGGQFFYENYVYGSWQHRIRKECIRGLYVLSRAANQRICSV